jgi:hypothetical protein
MAFDSEFDAAGFDATDISAGTDFLRVSNGANVLTLPIIVLY